MIERNNAVARWARFATRLRQAVHDVRHERSGTETVVHYWDTSCLWIAAWGSPFDQNADAMDVLAASLLSAGRIRGISLLKAHRDEFAVSIGKSDEFESFQVADEEWIDRLRGHLDEEDLDGLIELLGSKVPDTRELVEQLAQASPHLFAVVESIAPRGLQRVTRLFEEPTPRLLLRHLGPPTEDIVDRTSYREALQFLTELRPTRAFGNAVDAAAVVALQILAAQAAAGGSTILPRFYTSSVHTRALLASPAVSPQLGIWVESNEPVPYADTVLRDAEYYVLRAAFPALGFGSQNDLSSPPGWQLEELDRLSVGLHESLRSGEADFLNFVVQSVAFGDRSVADTFDELPGRRVCSERKDIVLHNRSRTRQG